MQTEKYSHESAGNFVNLWTKHSTNTFNWVGATEGYFQLQGGLSVARQYYWNKYYNIVNPVQRKDYTVVMHISYFVTFDDGSGNWPEYASCVGLGIPIIDQNGNPTTYHHVIGEYVYKSGTGLNTSYTPSYGIFTINKDATGIGGSYSVSGSVGAHASFHVLTIRATFHHDGDDLLWVDFKVEVNGTTQVTRKNWGFGNSYNTLDQYNLVPYMWLYGWNGWSFIMLQKVVLS